MNQAFIVVGVAVGVIAQPPAAAHGYGKDDLQVRHPWTRATPPSASSCTF